jgi:hypothetical protein
LNVSAALNASAAEQDEQQLHRQLLRAMHQLPRDPTTKTPSAAVATLRQVQHVMVMLPNELHFHHKRLHALLTSKRVSPAETGAAAEELVFGGEEGLTGSRQGCSQAR